MPLRNYTNPNSNFLNAPNERSGEINPFYPKFLDLLKNEPLHVFTSERASDFYASHLDTSCLKILEIGSYYGHTLQQLCRDFPNAHIIGMDITYKRIVRSFERIKLQNQMTNFSLLFANAKQVDLMFPQNFLDGILVFFPDPWPKSRHEKHRLVDVNFLQKLKPLLRKNAFIWLKTDQKFYFDTAKIALQSESFILSEKPESFQHEASYHSCFEKRFLQQGYSTHEGFWRWSEPTSLSRP